MKIEMKKLILLLLPALALAQKTNGIVRDSVTGKPIPYVSVWLENEDISTMADSLGQYAIRTTNAGKTVVFSAAGYVPKKVKLPETRGLKLRPIAFPECLPRTKRTETVTLGADYKIRKADLTFGNEGKPWMLARKFTPTTGVAKTPFLDKLTLYTDSHNNNMKLGLRFFAIDQNGNPGTELTDKLVIFRVDHGRENTVVDLSLYNIQVPESGFFVAVSWLIIDQNVKKWYDKRPMRYKDYDPGVGTMPSDTSSTWEYSAGRWAQMQKFPADYDHRSYRGKFAEIAMQLTLSN
jgi:hypothetical protein